MSEYIKAELESHGDDGLEVKVTIEGKTDMPFWNHDLKVKAIKALLETIDRKHYFEADKYEEFDNEMEELQNILNSVRELY